MKLPIPALLVLVYGAWVLAGTLLLKLPAAANVPVSWSDAVFTATSAVTVTGLVVLDTGADLTVFGQGVVMVLIQLGGMGLMTFACVALSSLGLRIGLSHRMYLAEEMGLDDLGGLVDLVWSLFRIVLVCELVGMAMLASVWVPEFGWRRGLWEAAFHSVSAFNNAGFSTFPGSLMGWVEDPRVVWTISLQFMVGGLGFAVLTDLFRTRGWRGLTLHSKLMLVGTVVLIAAGVGGYAALEWTNPRTLGTLPSPLGKLQGAWFEGVTPRTAGFNALDTAGTRDATTLLTMALMLVGGGTTSTAGGIKVTTAVVLVLATVAFFRNSGRIAAFGYSIGLSQGLKVMALLTVSVFVLLGGLFLLLATHDLPFLDATFEVVSAFGTVGLSRGATGELSDLGRAVVILIMFLGRLGPLTLGFFLARQTAPRVRYPEGAVYLG